MGDMLEYIKWRGDLTFEQSGFSEVDNLIISYFSYVNLDGVVPEEGKGEITIVEAADKFYRLHSQKELEQDKSFIRRAPEVLKTAAKSRRFQKTVLRNYINRIEEDLEQQFSAVEAVLEDGTSYVAYKGTDDTIVGWKEDFNLSKGIVPAELEAAKYLDRIVSESITKLRVGGHSKGGNLAEYAAVNCKDDVRAKIIEVYSNDGPGFAESFFENPNLEEMKSKMYHIIPEGSVIGMILRQINEPIVIESSQKGILQHDGFSWQIMGPSFIHKKEISNRAKVLNATLDKWIFNMDEEKRNAVIEDFFSVLEATGAYTLTELQKGGLANIRIMLAKVNDLNPETKESVEELIRNLIGHWDIFLPGSLIQRKSEKS